MKLWHTRKFAMPLIGRSYYLCGQVQDPWGLRGPMLAHVVDVKSAWVRYRIGNAPTDDVLSVREFSRLYELVTTNG